MKIFGHRGAAGLAPENTLVSIRRAIQFGVDGVEFDVRCTMDRVPVLMHDASVDRTTDGTGALDGYSLDRLRRLRIAEKERIPTLEEALQLIGRQTEINVELKEPAACEPTARLIDDAIQAGTILPQQLLVSSFDHGTLREFRHLAPGIAIGLLTKDPPTESYWNLAEELSAKSANIASSTVTREFVDRAQAAGMQVMAYTINSKQELDRLDLLGVDAIFTDNPELTIS